MDRYYAERTEKDAEKQPDQGVPALKGREDAEVAPLYVEPGTTLVHPADARLSGSAGGYAGPAGPTEDQVMAIEHGINDGFGAGPRPHSADPYECNGEPGTRMRTRFDPETGRLTLDDYPEEGPGGNGGAKTEVQAGD